MAVMAVGAVGAAKRRCRARAEQRTVPANSKRIELDLSNLIVIYLHSYAVIILGQMVRAQRRRRRKDQRWRRRRCARGARTAVTPLPKRQRQWHGGRREAFRA